MKNSSGEPPPLTGVSCPMTPFLAAISGQEIVNVFVWLIVAALIFWLLNWLIGYVGLGEPFLKIAKVVLGVVAVLFIVNLLLGLVGHAPVKF
jgi:hypothetical protein